MARKFGFTPVVDGDDLVVRGTIASNFGDPADVASGQDNGVGASGFRYIDHPEYMGVALPMRGFKVPSLYGSPIPKLPWYTDVRVFCPATNKVVMAKVVDLGPSGGLNRGIDLLQAVVKGLGLRMKDGLYRVDYRIIGGAKYLPK